MKVTKHVLTENIILVRFANEADIARTFLRFQEHYESPRFAGKIFTYDEYKKWYKKEFGKFDYYEEWYDGFNIPSSILKKFYAGEFNPITKKEKVILDLLKEHTHDYYIIAVHHKEDKSIFHHELAHALFYTEENYKKTVLKIMQKYDLSHLEKILHEVDGYGKHVIRDEIQAYSVACYGDIKAEFPEKMRKDIRKVFDEYLKKMKL
ncbi:MAG: ABC transporter ATP-binding protein [Nanoarchaeota archaeon]